MRTYWNFNGSLRTTDEWEPNCWTQITCPTQDDEDFLFNQLNVPTYFWMTSGIRTSARVMNTTRAGC